MKVDTVEMKSIAGEINQLAVQYQTKISQMYNKIAQMPTVTKEWTGNKAQEYVSYVMLDKTDMMIVGDRIKDFARDIIDTANRMESFETTARGDETDD
ncbi:MAG: hypothetical protein IKQ06_01590 [Bacilli bacterium]|nr:hypothetical protein [Bacilli bacterium]